MSLNKNESIMELCSLGYSADAAQEIFEMVNPNLVTKVPCEIWSRSVGYFRPVNQWNKGKQEEFGERAKLNISGTEKRGC